MLSPRENPDLFGHEDAEKIFLDSYNSGKLPHAWLITGDKGIGKATLAYRIARFLLKNGTPVQNDGGLFGDELNSNPAESLYIDSNDPLFTRIIAGGHADLLALEVNKEEGKTEIPVDSIRKINGFLAHTAAESDYRIIIIDSADEMNRNAANALLKLLEEPPKNTILLLVSHSSGRLLPTIKSRCRFLRLKPLASNYLKEILDKNSNIENPCERDFAIEFSNGSPGIALDLFNNNGLEIYNLIIEALTPLPNIDLNIVHKIGDMLARKENIDRWHIAIYMYSNFLASIIEAAISNNLPENEIVNGENQVQNYLIANNSVENLVDLWEKIGKIATETNGLNMDRKMSVIELFGILQTA